MTDVTVVGGGVIGLSIAEELVRAGATVRVLDRTSFGSEASWAGAGMLPPGNLDRATTPEAQLRGLSHRLWPGLVERLRDRTQVDSGYRVCGSVRVFSSEAKRNAEIAAWRAEGVSVKSLDPAEMRAIEPALTVGDRPSIYLPGEAQIRNPRHLKALVASCAAQKVELVPNSADVSFDTVGERIVGIRTSAGEFHSDRYCITAGAWSRGLLSPLGIDLPIHPVRGQIVLLNASPRQLDMIVELGSRYLVPRPDGRVLAGSTMEDAGFDKRNTASAVGELLAMATRICPAMGSATVERFWAGLRPGSPDGLPYLGAVPGFNNLFIAAGHFRSGLQMSPGTAQVMCQVLLDQPTDIPLEAFSLSRHPHADALHAGLE